MKYVIDLNDDWVATSPLRGKELTIPITINNDVMYVPTSIKLEEISDATWDKYQIWKLKNDQHKDKRTGISVGDEIEHLDSMITAIVTYITPVDPMMGVIYDDGCVEMFDKSELVDEWKSTGRHFDVVNSMLQTLREDE